MNVERIWSAAELEALTPDERAAAIQAGFVTDASEVPEHLFVAARGKADAEHLRWLVQQGRTASLAGRTVDHRRTRRTPRRRGASRAT